MLERKVNTTIRSSADEQCAEVAWILQHYLLEIRKLHKLLEISCTCVRNVRKKMKH